MSETASILVVDDDILNLKVVMKRLEREGYTVAVEGSAEEALGRLQLESFDLVLLDINMPGMDGFQLLKKIKADNRFASTRVIMVTGTDDKDMMLKCIKAGASDYLQKPFNMGLANRRIAAVLQDKSSYSADQTSLVGEDSLSGCVLVVDDDPDNREILKKRMMKMGLTVETAENGAEALAAMNPDRFDLILLDIDMPTMGGEEVIRNIKSHPKLKETPVIMISASDDIDNVLHFVDLGAVDFISKPFNAALLSNRVRQCLGAR